MYLSIQVAQKKFRSAINFVTTYPLPDLVIESVITYELLTDLAIPQMNQNGPLIQPLVMASRRSARARFKHMQVSTRVCH